jgi:hypothetical protein
MMYVCNLLTNVILGTRITGIRGPQALALAPYKKSVIKINESLQCDFFPIPYAYAHIIIDRQGARYSRQV